MQKQLPALLVFLAGLLPACWIGAGYVTTNPVGAIVALVILASYVVGALELRQHRQATRALDEALNDAGPAGADLPGWLARLPATLQTPVRQRIETGRGVLPGPALTPYLVGLLVLLGMLGTLLGMMATLRGTGVALGSAEDLQAVRGALGAPVEGLAVAFGTSIAGVAASAMLGLLSALARRDRAAVAQRLDRAIAGPLQPHSHAHQHTSTLQLLQQQSALMPALVERLDALAKAIADQGSSTSERLLTGQADFQRHSEASQAELAQRIQQTLQQGVDATAAAVGAAMQPVLERTLDSVASQAGALNTQVADAVQRQLDALTTGFDAAARTAAGHWSEAVTEQRDTNAALCTSLRDTLDTFSAQQLARATAADAAAAQRDAATHARLSDTWDALAERQRADSAALASTQQQALTAAGEAIHAQADALLSAVHDAHQTLRAGIVEDETARLQAWSRTVEELGQQSAQGWQQIADDVAARQQQTCAALESVATEISSQSRAHATATIEEVARLVQTATDAPRAAAEVIAGLRQQLSDSMARDTEMLEERARLLGTLQTLLDALSHASTEQRDAVDALVARSAELMQRTGEQLQQQVQADARTLGDAATQVTASAVEVAGLGDAFGTAVSQFGGVADGLGERLQQVATALEAAQVRSDEQLAYYVAQAREMVDLSVLSQKQIIEQLQQMGTRGDEQASA